MSILSEVERERRWKKVRSAMKKQGLQCLLLFGTFCQFGQHNANLRYLCNSATEGYLVFPIEDEPTLFAHVVHREPSQWVHDCRSGHPMYSRLIAQRLKDLHLQNTRIGVVAISGYFGERGFPYSTYVSLVEDLPRAKFEDATEMIENARMIKSPEEIKCMELACEIGEKVIQAVVGTAKVGIRDNEVRAKMMDTMLRNGCEHVCLFLYGSGKELISAGHGSWVGYRSSRALKHGDVILTEFDAKYLGYGGQFNQPFTIGEPSKEWEDIYSVALRAFNNGLSTLRPGITAGELDEAFLSTVRESDYTNAFPHFHGLGLSVEEPCGTFPLQPLRKANKDLRIEAGMILEFEPHVVARNGKIGIHIGSPVLVTRKGCRLLSKNWKPELIRL